MKVARAFPPCHRHFPAAVQVGQHNSHVALTSLMLRLSLTPSLLLKAVLLSVSRRLAYIWVHFALSPFLLLYMLFLVNL